MDISILDRRKDRLYQVSWFWVDGDEGLIVAKYHDPKKDFEYGSLEIPMCGFDNKYAVFSKMFKGGKYEMNMKVLDTKVNEEYEVYKFGYDEEEDFVSVIYKDGESFHWIKEDNKVFSERYRFI